MLNNRLTQQLKLFFLEQHANLGFVENKFIRVDIIINKILQDPEINISFCKIFCPDMGLVKILNGKWITEILEGFFASQAAKQILEIFKDQNSDLAYIKLLCSKNKVTCDPEQYYQEWYVFSLLIKNIIQQYVCPLSVIKEQLVVILNKEQELAIFLQPLLIKLTNKQLSFKNGDLVRYLRRMNFLSSYKDAGETYFYLKELDNSKIVTFTKHTEVGYKVQQEDSYEQAEDNNLLSIRSTIYSP